MRDFLAHIDLYILRLKKELLLICKFGNSLNQPRIFTKHYNSYKILKLKDELSTKNGINKMTYELFRIQLYNFVWILSVPHLIVLCLPPF